jgi:hypothetical protein
MSRVIAVGRALSCATRNTMIEAATLLEVVLDEAKFEFYPKTTVERAASCGAAHSGTPPTNTSTSLILKARARSSPR